MVSHCERSEAIPSVKSSQIQGTHGLLARVWNGVPKSSFGLGVESACGLKKASTLRFPL